MKKSNEFRSLNILLGIVMIVSSLICINMGEQFLAIKLNYLYLFGMGFIEEFRIRKFLRKNSEGKELASLTLGIEQRKRYKAFIRNSSDSTVVTRGLEHYLLGFKVLVFFMIINAVAGFLEIAFS